jgi:Fe-S cluster assembly protein SufB
VETGSAITWKYPSCILKGDDSVGEFYSVALTNNRQQADTGTKMIHIGKNTKSTIVSKGISAGRGQNTYRGLVKVNVQRGERPELHPVRLPAARRPLRRAHLPLHRGGETRRADRARGDDQQDRRRPALLLQSARHREEDAVGMIVNGFCKEVFNELPMEFAVEAQKLLEISLEGSVG